MSPAMSSAMSAQEILARYAEINTWGPHPEGDHHWWSWCLVEYAPTGPAPLHTYYVLFFCRCGEVRPSPLSSFLRTTEEHRDEKKREIAAFSGTPETCGVEFFLAEQNPEGPTGNPPIPFLPLL